MSRRYRAFISYSHGDERWARWLQRALEGYRLPKTLRQQHPDLPARLFPIFRDRDELASANDLSESIQRAMDDSDALVVICSPGARASHWVNQEILRFRQSDRGDRIYCLIVSGSPDPNSPDCAFPSALLADAEGRPVHEPLAADATANGDGRRNAMLKIAAGLLGVGVDDLKRRDAQRQARFWSFVALGSALIATITIGLAIYAFNARKESELRRQQAEGLIGFMLGDLREKLEPIGKLELLDAVGDQAMAYFATLGEHGTTKEMLARAVALKQIGDVRFNQGELDPALDAFEQALAQTKALHASAPTNNDYLFELGQAEFWVGYVAWQRGELDKAAAAMRRYMEISRQLVDREPDNADYQLELSYAHGNLGSVSVAQGNYTQALDEFRESAEIAQTLLKATPDDADLAMNLSDSLSWLGTTQLNLGNLQAARDEFGKAADIIRPFHAKGDDKRTSDYYARALLRKADVLIQMGVFDEAREILAESGTVYANRLKSDPTNKLLQTEMIRVDAYRLGFTPLSAWGDDELAELARLLGMIEAMSEAAPTDRDIQLHMTQLRTLKLHADLHAGRTDALSEAAAGYWQDWQQWVKGQKLDMEMRHAGNALAHATGLAYSKAGREVEAKSLWAEADKALGEMKSRNPEILATQWHLALALGQMQKADALRSTLNQIGYVDIFTGLPIAAPGKAP